MKNNIFLYAKKSNILLEKNILFLAALIHGVALFLYCQFIIAPVYPYIFPLNVNGGRMLNAGVWCVAAFLFMRYKVKKESMFFLMIILWTQIIPLSVVFSVCGGDLVFFNIVCGGFILCIVLTQYIKPMVKYINLGFSTDVLYIGCCLVVLYMFVSVALANGTPALTALNIYKVYEIRSSGMFEISKYIGYIMRNCIFVLIPALIANDLINKHYGFQRALPYIVIVIVIYLYSGHKIYLFSIPVIFVCSLWSRRRLFCLEVFTAFSFIMSALVIYVMYVDNGMLYTYVSEFLSLIYRRVFLIPARIAFYYADFFSDHTLFGLHGLLPRFMLDESPYPGGFIIGQEIGWIYMGLQTNASTGMLGDSIMHFGLPGVVCAWGFLAILLRHLDSLQQRSSYCLVVGTFCFLIYSFSTGPLWGSMLVGPVMAAILFMLFYSKKA